MSDIFQKVKSFIDNTKWSPVEPIFTDLFPNHYKQGEARIVIYGQEDWQWDENSDFILEYTVISQNIMLLIYKGRVYDIRDMHMSFNSITGNHTVIFNSANLLEGLIAN